MCEPGKSKFLQINYLIYHKLFFYIFIEYQIFLNVIFKIENCWKFCQKISKYDFMILNITERKFFRFLFGYLNLPSKLLNFIDFSLLTCELQCFYKI